MAETKLLAVLLSEESTDSNDRVAAWAKSCGSHVDRTQLIGAKDIAAYHEEEIKAGQGVTETHEAYANVIMTSVVNNSYSSVLLVYDDEHDQLISGIIPILRKQDIEIFDTHHGCEQR